MVPDLSKPENHEQVYNYWHFFTVIKNDRFTSAPFKFIINIFYGEI